MTTEQLEEYKRKVFNCETLKLNGKELIAEKLRTYNAIFPCSHCCYDFLCPAIVEEVCDYINEHSPEDVYVFKSIR